MKRPVVKTLLLGLLLSTTPLWTIGTAQAASPLDDYLAARDRYVKDINRAAANGIPPELSEREERARADLQKKLKALIGPVTITGFPPEGRINLDTLLEELGYGRLDGLAYTVPNPDTEVKRTTVVVSTEALLKSWLKAHRNWWPGRDNVPQTVAEALRSEAFYTQAISPDAAFAVFAEIPLTAPAETKVLSAMLGLYRQDIGPWMPTEIVVSVVRGDRVFVFSQSAAVTVEPIPVCDQIWQSYQKKADRAFAAYRASGLKDEKRFDERSRLEEKGDRAHRECFAKHVKEQPYFPALLRQAQALVNALPSTVGRGSIQKLEP